MLSESTLKEYLKGMEYWLPYHQSLVKKYPNDEDFKRQLLILEIRIIEYKFILGIK